MERVGLPRLQITRSSPVIKRSYYTLGDLESMCLIQPSCCVQCVLRTNCMGREAHLPSMWFLATCYTQSHSETVGTISAVTTPGCTVRAFQHAPSEEDKKETLVNPSQIIKMSAVMYILRIITKYLSASFPSWNKYQTNYLQNEKLPVMILLGKLKRISVI